MPSVLGTSRKPDVLFRKRGIIDIKAAVVTALDLQPGDSIDLWEHDDGNLFIYAIKHNVGSHKAVCRRVNAKCKYLRVCCKQLTDYVNALTGKTESHVPVGPVVQLPNIGKAMPLITRLNFYCDDK